MPRPTALLPLLTALLLVGCNDYEMFRLAGHKQESFSNRADILFVVDRSGSMQEESEALAMSFRGFMHLIADPTASGTTYDGLDDAVANYIRYSERRGRFLDYQLAITAPDMSVTGGRLIGDPPILTRAHDAVAEQFIANLLCEATCWAAGSVPDNRDYVCGDDIEFVTKEYLDCTCPGGWREKCASGQEEHLEALFIAMCRAVENPPEECFGVPSVLKEEDALSNAGLLRDDSTLIAVFVTDEGDVSRRITQGRGDPQLYLDLLAKFERRLAVAVIGPNRENLAKCHGQEVAGWQVERMDVLVDESNGRWVNIAEPSADGEGCEVQDFTYALEELGDLLTALTNKFHLQAIPDVETIRVFVDGKRIERAEQVPGSFGAKFMHGWSYDAAENAVEFHGDAQPDFNADVKIFYRPLDGMPRELPH